MFKKGVSGIKNLEEYSKRETVLLDIIIWHVTQTFKILIEFSKMTYFLKSQIKT